MKDNNTLNELVASEVCCVQCMSAVVNIFLILMKLEPLAVTALLSNIPHCVLYFRETFKLNAHCFMHDV